MSLQEQFGPKYRQRQRRSSHNETTPESEPEPEREPAAKKAKASKRNAEEQEKPPLVPEDPTAKKPRHVPNAKEIECMLLQAMINQTFLVKRGKTKAWLHVAAEMLSLNRDLINMDAYKGKEESEIQQKLGRLYHDKFNDLLLNHKKRENRSKKATGSNEPAETQVQSLLTEIQEMIDEANKKEKLGEKKERAVADDIRNEALKMIGMSSDTSESDEDRSNADEEDIPNKEKPDVKKVKGSAPRMAQIIRTLAEQAAKPPPEDEALKMIATNMHAETQAKADLESKRLTFEQAQADRTYEQTKAEQELARERIKLEQKRLEMDQQQTTQTMKLFQEMHQTTMQTFGQLLGAKNKTD